MEHTFGGDLRRPPSVAPLHFERRERRASAAPTFAAWSDAQVVGALALSALAWAVIGVGYFRYAENRARALGLIDWQTQY